MHTVQTNSHSYKLSYDMETNSHGFENVNKEAWRLCQGSYNLYYLGKMDQRHQLFRIDCLVK